MRPRHRDLRIPVGAPREGPLVELVREHLDDLPNHLGQIARELWKARDLATFDLPFRMVAERVDAELESIVRGPEHARFGLLLLARLAIPSQGAWWIRPLVNAPEGRVRGAARTALKGIESPDVFLRNNRFSSSRGLALRSAPLARHRRGSAARAEHGVPDWATVGDLRAGLRLQRNQLAYLLVASDEPREGTRPPYRVEEIPKRGGGVRTLHVPCGHLRGVQRKILRRVLEPIAPHDAAHGFVKWRSVATHAQLHAGRAIVVCFDLVDFFPTVHYFRAVGLFASLGYDVSEGRFSAHDDHRGVAETLARLCIYTPSSWKPGGGFTPQGAPTSPAIANLVCRRLDSRLSGLAAKIGGRYSRYADDLTFSFEADPPGGLGRFRWWVDAICHQEGFLVHRGKFRVMRQSQRQIVTGVVVNERPRLSRRDRRRFRAILHNCRTHGVDSQARGNPGFRSWLRGYAAWIHAVDPEEGRVVLDQVDELLGGA